MNTVFVRRSGCACLGLMAVAFLTLLTPRVASSAPGVIEVCINPGNGGLRLVDSTTACHKNETRVNWNIVGLQGPQGLQGEQGLQGVQGIQPTPGAQISTGEPK